MKTFKKILFAFAFIALVASCQSNTDVKQILSNANTRKAIIDTICNGSEMSKEMMTAMMNNKNCSMRMMKEDPAMMKEMMSGMMACCKNDTAMMTSMCKSMMADSDMMSCMHKMNSGDKDMKKMNHSKHH